MQLGNSSLCVSWVERASPALTIHPDFRKGYGRQAQWTCQTAELGFGPSVITNVGVFQHILCNFEVNWRLVASPKDAENLEPPLNPGDPLLHGQGGSERENHKGFGAQRPRFIINSYHQQAVWPRTSLLTSLSLSLLLYERETIISPSQAGAGVKSATIWEKILKLQASIHKRILKHPSSFG